MKKPLILILILCIGASVSAWEFEWAGLIPAGFGLNVSEGGTSGDLEINFLPHLLYDEYGTGICFKWIPFSYMKINNEDHLGFLNLSCFWNINYAVWNISEKLIDLDFGPFVSANMTSKGIIISAGMVFYFSLPFIYSEIGYRNINGNHGFYMNFVMDLPLLGLASVWWGL